MVLDSVVCMCQKKGFRLDPQLFIWWETNFLWGWYTFDIKLFFVPI